MTTETTTVTCNAGKYTQITTASTGYALIYNPIDSGGNLAIYNGATIPSPFTEAAYVLKPDEAFQRTSDITDHLWGYFADGSTKKVVITE